MRGRISSRASGRVSSWASSRASATVLGLWMVLGIDYRV